MEKNIIKSLCIVLGIMFLSACTNLDETIYDQVESNNFYNTRKDVERVVARPFEHCYHMLQFRHFLQELIPAVKKEGIRHTASVLSAYPTVTHSPTVSGEHPVAACSVSAAFCPVATMV